MKSKSISRLSTIVIAIALSSVHAADFTWGGGDLPWTDTSASGWAGGPPAGGDTATINSGTVTLTSEHQEDGVAITLGGSGVLNAPDGGHGDYFDGYSSLTFGGGGTLTAAGAGGGGFGAGILGSFSVTGSSATGSVINATDSGYYFNVWGGSVFNVADVTGNADADLTISATLTRLPSTAASITKTGAGTMAMSAVNNSLDALTVGDGTVLLTANNVLNSISNITIGAGAKISQTTGSWNQINNLTLQGGTLESTIVSTDNVWGAYQLPNTVSVSGSSASTISTNGSGNIFINLGLAVNDDLTYTTFNVADVTSSTAADLTISTALGNNIANNFTSSSAAGLIKDGSGTMALTAANTYTGGTAINAGTLEFTSGCLGSTAYVGLVGGTLQWAPGNTDALGNIFIYNGTTGTLDTNGNDVTLAAIQDNEFNRTGSLVKTGAGVLTFTGTNSYTGSTTVNAGTLELAAGSQLKFFVEDATTNQVTGSGTVVFKGIFNIDTSAVTVGPGATWTLVDVANLTESFDPSFSVADFDPQPDGHTWTKPAGANKFSFDKNTGVLSLVVAATDYETWKSANGVTGGENDDDDNDGLTNHEEYAFALDPTGGSSVNPITVPLNKTTGTFTYTRRTQSLTGLAYTVWSSIDLVSWAPATFTDSVTGPVADVETVQVTLTPAPTAPKFFVQVRAN